jgi:phage baseplate assembly protein W
MPNYDPEIYSDLSYKPQLNQLGDVTKLVNKDAIRQAVKTIVLTPPGSRLFEPEFGCGIGSYLFELLDEDTAQSIKKSVKNALKTYETRIVVSEVTVDADPDNNQLNVEITYLIQELQEYDSTKIALSKL